MEGYNDYDALAISTKIEDIPYISEHNKGTNVDSRGQWSTWKNLWIPGNNVKELGWLGYYLGRNTTLQELYFLSRTIHDANFYIGLNNNKSIKKIVFLGIDDIDFRDGQMFQMVASFLKNNHNLTKFEVDYCELEAEGHSSDVTCFGEL